jgi:hypothetical protein
MPLYRRRSLLQLEILEGGCIYEASWSFVGNLGSSCTIGLFSCWCSTCRIELAIAGE